MEKFADLRGARVSVLGLGVSNRPLIDFLLDAGAQVEARDMKTREALGDLPGTLEAKGVRLVLGENYLEDITGDLIFRSPGIRPDAGGIPAALARGAKLTSEMELFLETTPATVIALTGSDGKTTSTTLTAKILEATLAKLGSDRRVFLGGNIGTPLLPRVGEMREGDFAVVELSSFQLQTMRAPAVLSIARAAITNITPNHLNWHTGMEEYIGAKKRIFAENPTSSIVLNAVNAVTAEIASAISPERVTLFTAHAHGYAEVSAPCPGAHAIYEEEGIVVLDDGWQRRPLLTADAILLPGRHNLENYMTAIALTEGLIPGAGDAYPAALLDVASTFPGVPHRLEYVRTRRGVRFYNSSIDSSPTRTAAALDALAAQNVRPIVICGGYDKHIPFAPLAEALAARAKQVVLTGATADKIDAALSELAATGRELPPILRVPDFSDAVLAAADAAGEGDTVLLSPACASFDAFVNFEARGERFREIVNGLPD